jgi:hypothetical protein
LFELIAEEVWDSIAFNHGRGIQKSELGITNDIVSVIRENYYMHRNFGIWANLGVNEADNGGDLDIFVETDANQFLWYALQAKVLKVGGTYDRLISKPQWVSLERLRNSTGCIPFYLFYNGVNKELETVKDCCKDDINEKQFGCTIVEINKVAQIATRRSNPRYIDFYPTNGHPWRELVCCMAKRRDGALFSLEQIQNTVSYYSEVINSEIIFRGTNNEEISGDSLTMIRNSNARVGRYPAHTFVIRTSAGMNQNTI